MRRTERVDLSELDPAAIATPPTGERLIHDSLAIGLALRLRTSGARTWITLVTDGGKTVRRTLGDATSVPIGLARALVGGSAESAHSSLPAPARFQASATVAVVIEAYLTSGLGRHWTASTGTMMRSVTRHHILPTLGEKIARDMTRGDVRLWHGELARRTTSERMALSTLSVMMRYAEDHGLRDAGSNPCRGFRKRNSAERGSHLSPLLIRRIWEALDGHQRRMPDACDVIRLLLLTGARKSEMLGLHWGQIVGCRAVLDSSKTGPRTIWLNAPARVILDGRRGTDAGDFVFPGRRRGDALSSVDRHWDTIRQAAGAPALRLHDLRHHYAAVGVSNGIDLKVVGDLLGHHDIDSTLIYAHLATAALVRSADRVSWFISKLAGQDRPASGGRMKPRKRSETGALPARRIKMEERHA